MLAFRTGGHSVSLRVTPRISLVAWAAKVLKKPFILLIMRKNKRNICLCCLSDCVFAACGNKRSGRPKILVFSKTVTLRHSFISPKREAIIKLANGERFYRRYDRRRKGYFNEDSLEKYSAVVFLNTTDTKDSLLNTYYLKRL